MKSTNPLPLKNSSDDSSDQGSVDEETPVLTPSQEMEAEAGKATAYSVQDNTY